METLTTLNQEEQLLQDHFAAFRLQAEGWMGIAKTIQVTDESQTEQMQAAKEARLGLRMVRIGVDKKHKELKEEALRYGQTLDKIKRTLTGMIEPIEAHLQEQEDFAKVQEERKKQAIITERIKVLSRFMPAEEARKLPLGEMSLEAFGNMLEGYEGSAKKRAQEEAERKAKAEADEKERIRLAAENKKLNDKLEKERKEKKRLEDEAEVVRQKEEQRKKDEANARRREQRAPDKDKLESLKNDLFAIAGKYKMTSEEGQAVLDDVKILIGKITAHITKKAEQL